VVGALNDLKSEGKLVQTVTAADRAQEIRGCVEDIRDIIMDYQVRPGRQVVSCRADANGTLRRLFSKTYTGTWRMI